MEAHGIAAKPISAHFRATLVLGMPLIGAHLAQMLIGVTDTIMLGWLGTSELAGGTLAFQVFFVLLIFGFGFGAAMMPLIAGALGKGDPRGVRRASRMGLWALLGLSILFQIPLWFTGDILTALRQDPQPVQLAVDYMRVAQWSMIPAMLLVGLRSILASVERANAVLVTTLVGVVLNAVLNYAFIFGNFGAPALGMQGAGIATVLANAISVLVVLAYMLREPAIKPYDIFTRLWRPDWAALRELSWLGIPISLTIFAEAGLFSAASIMVGWLGTLQLAAHGIALQVASIAFMVPLGLAQAGSVRVGNALGRRNAKDIGRAGYATLVLAVGFSVVSALVLFAAPEPLVSLFLDTRNKDAVVVIAAAVPLVWMAAAFQLVDGTQVVAAGALRGLKDTRIPMIIAAFSYWVIGLTAAYGLAFWADFGAVGVWGGLAVGLAVAAIALTGRFVYRDRFGLTHESHEISQ